MNTVINSTDHDQSQRQLALDPSQSFIVQAPAGSGKTELLIQRFLTLLQYVKKPEEILAVTFTKKAANEMRARVLKALHEAISSPAPETPHGKLTRQIALSVLKRDKELNWHLLDNPNQLRIQTIDSFCSYLTNQLPLLSHFGAQPALSDNSKVLYEEAVREVLVLLENNNEWSQSISIVLAHLDNDLNKLHEFLSQLLSKRDQWIAYVISDESENDIRIRLEHNLQSVINDYLHKLQDYFPTEIAGEIINLTRFMSNQIHLNTGEVIYQDIANLTELPEPSYENKDIWTAITQLFFTKSKTLRKKVDYNIGFPALATFKNKLEKQEHEAYRARYKELIDQLGHHTDLIEHWKMIGYLPNAQYSDEQWHVLKALFLLLKLTYAQLRMVFQKYGCIDFIENSQAAILSLGDAEKPTDLAFLLDYQIKHILMDEFQDTSYTQYQLLEKLTYGWQQGDGRTLFIVGDPMQSIYRFREAEVGLFIRMQSQGIHHLQLTPLTLSVNFRSHRSIVEWNNKHFTAIFPAQHDIAAGAVTFSKSITREKQDLEISDIQLHGYLSANKNSQAFRIIELIRQQQTKAPDETIAILVRSRSHLEYIIPALKNAKISYQAIEIDLLKDRQHIQDLLSLTSALTHPADRIAWLSILRAPWCGLSLADLLSITQFAKEKPLWSAITQPDCLHSLSPDGQQRLTKLIKVMSYALSDYKRLDLYSWVKSTWMALGGPATLNNESELQEVYTFFDTLDHAENDDTHLLKQQLTSLYSNNMNSDSKLQIMTIHAAKGLEFDTVILPHLEKKPPINDKALFSWLELPLQSETMALLMAPIHATGEEQDPIYNFIRHQQLIKTKYETDRLLYVATTRAKKHLHLLFNIEKNASDEYQYETDSFLSKLAPLIETKINDYIINQEAAIELNEKIKSPRAISRLVSHWQNPIQFNQLNSALHEKINGLKLDDTKSKIIGTTTHRIFQIIANLGITWWQQLAPNIQQHYIDSEARKAGVGIKDLQHVVKECHRLLVNTLNDDRGKWILQQHHDDQTEFALTALIDNKIEMLVIDRTFVDENHIRWIIDYKTAPQHQADLTLFLQNEKNKYLEKMQHYAKAMQHLDDRQIKLGLYFPAIPAWQEWEG